MEMDFIEGPVRKSSFAELAPFLILSFVIGASLPFPYMLLAPIITFYPVATVRRRGLWLAVEGPVLSWKVLGAFTRPGPEGSERVSLTDIASIALVGEELVLAHDDGRSIRIPAPRRHADVCRDALDQHRVRLRAGAVGPPDAAHAALSALSRVRDGVT